MTPTTKQKAQLSVRIDQAVLDTAHQMAEEEHTNITHILEQAIRDRARSRRITSEEQHLITWFKGYLRMDTSSFSVIDDIYRSGLKKVLFEVSKMPEFEKALRSFDDVDND